MPIAQATAVPASAIQARVQRLVISASMEKPTPNTRLNHVKIRDGSAIPTLIAASLPMSTSTPLIDPVCGRMKDSTSTKTKIATTNPLAPGSISPATRRSAASMSAR